MFFRRICWMLILVVLATAPVAAQTCDTEIKLLLEPGQLNDAVKALDAGTSTGGKIFFFDTAKRDLFAHGVILRARRGGSSDDLIVKVRTSDHQTLSVADPGAGFKCEFDRTGDTVVRSYSVRAAFRGELPMTGEDLFRSLNHDQKKLLNAAGVHVDWKKVMTVAEIKSRVWKVRNEAGFGKLSLELWQWSSAQVLELSTKTKSDDSSSAAALRQLVIGKGLRLRPSQTQKTRLALDAAASSD